MNVDIHWASRYSSVNFYMLWTGITDKSILSSLLSLDLSNSANKDYAIDIRDSAVQWINDIENDKEYRRWSSSLLDLLRPTFPGMLRSVRRNLYNLVIMLFWYIVKWMNNKSKKILICFTILIIFHNLFHSLSSFSFAIIVCL